MNKFSQSDGKYFSHRTKFAEKWAEQLTPWFVADQWPLFTGWVNIGRFLAISDLVRQVIDIPGNIIELGTWHGANLIWMAKLIRLLKPNSLTEIYGFDSFEGIKLTAAQDYLDPEHLGKYVGNEELLRDVIGLYEFDEFVHLIVGNIESTLPKFLDNRPEMMFSLVYCDTDLYNSTKVALQRLEERLVRGGIVIFDEFNSAVFPGETMAVREVFGDRYQLRTINWTRQPTAYIVKL